MQSVTESLCFSNISTNYIILILKVILDDSDELGLREAEEEAWNPLAKKQHFEVMSISFQIYFLLLHAVIFLSLPILMKNYT